MRRLRPTCPRGGTRVQPPSVSLMYIVQVGCLIQSCFRKEGAKKGRGALLSLLMVTYSGVRLADIWSMRCPHGEDISFCAQILTLGRSQSVKVAAPAKILLRTNWCVKNKKKKEQSDLSLVVITLPFKKCCRDCSRLQPRRNMREWPQERALGFSSPVQKKAFLVGCELLSTKYYNTKYLHIFKESVPCSLWPHSASVSFSFFFFRPPKRCSLVICSAAYVTRLGINRILTWVKFSVSNFRDVHRDKRDQEIVCACVQISPVLHYCGQGVGTADSENPSVLRNWSQGGDYQPLKVRQLKCRQCFIIIAVKCKYIQAVVHSCIALAMARSLQHQSMSREHIVLFKKRWPMLAGRMFSYRQWGRANVCYSCKRRRLVRWDVEKSVLDWCSLAVSQLIKSIAKTFDFTMNSLV